jgi:MerR family transcriptional regulator, light-induced transcriptional regulator
MATGRYKMRTISQKTGFSPGLLRAWERRHKFLEPVRGRGGHRLYTQADLIVLNRIRGLIDEGRSIGEIAALGREYLLADSPVVEGNGGESAVSEAVSEAVFGDRVAIFKKASDLIVQGAVQVDRGAIEKVLDRVFASCSAREVLYKIIIPSFQRIGELWAAGECSVAGEHLASGRFVQFLRRLLNGTQVWNQDSAEVICCCFPDEPHEFGSLLLAYEIAQLGISVTYLGQSVPFEDLEITYEKLEKPALCLSAVRSPIFFNHKHKLLEFIDRHEGMVLAVGGYGVPCADSDLLGREVMVWNHKESIEAFAARILSRIRQ